ncbi:MAG: 50S ribosomal protein L11 methyltransferase [Lachnospiraceae bacterium]|nr:50S ribosomal protein L11 methyltransferase [Ruminococcus sp.]MCM1274718.1 50S ribosomal protein L11 methyltransferase [Lachnospiraceae bacterium]
MDSFIQIDIYTSSQAIDGITGALTEYGINGFIIRDSADFEDFLADKNANWDYVDDELMGLKTVEPHITLYVHENAQGHETLAAIRGLVESYKANNSDGYYGNIRLALANVREEDWANNWKKYYKPFRVGKSLVIKPSWEDVEPNDGDKILEIDPASTFGTGQHHTTKMVMETLEDTIKGGERVLDLGCGSGILSIAALLLGAESAAICDIFENAVKTASENLEKNDFASFKAYCGNIIEDEKLRESIGGGYDVVCANIVADVIIAMSPLFKGFIKDGGRLIVSGVIDERLGEVKTALSENGWKEISSKTEEGWNCVLLGR